MCSGKENNKQDDQDHDRNELGKMSHRRKREQENRRACGETEREICLRQDIFLW
jgi:hypothetical protein